ncbi:GNAT family N-acetyltransferase [Spongisporangium articulatum]|uniref:GNAT family N-acetyltransferase n=1 Tax=Spongisporangium articulatum TaxID=3362603 RepID=A0ABW8AP06_9ACTN
MARVDEWPTLKDVRLRALADSPESFLESLAQGSARDEAGWRATFFDGSWHVAEVEGRWVGLARTRTYDDAPDEYYLEAFWIDPAHRDKGIGRRLIAHVARLAAADGRKRLRLAVLHSNDERRPIFEQLGFVADGQPTESEQQMVYRL